MQTPSELDLALADAGGADAPPECGARLRELLRAELERGARELGEARTGRERPIVARGGARRGRRGRGAAAGARAARRPRGGDRARRRAGGRRRGVPRGGGRARTAARTAPTWRCCSARTTASWRSPSRPPTRAGPPITRARRSTTRRLASTACARTPPAARPRDRGGGPAPADRRDPPAAGGGGRDAAGRLAARRGRPSRRSSRELLRLLEPDGSVTRAHDDPDPRRRVMRRILQRLDGMGKWGGYHTAFDHLARGFAGNERALAYEVGEELLAAGLLAQKPSVGQRHVSLNPRKNGEIRAADRRGRAAARAVSAAAPSLTRSPPSGLDAQREPAGHQLAQLVADQLAAPAVRPRAGGRRRRRGAAPTPAMPARPGSRSARPPRPPPSSGGAPAPGPATPAARRRSRAPAAPRGGGGGASLAAALDRLEQAVAAAVQRLGGQPADLLEAVAVARARAGPARSAPGRAAT